MPSNKEKRAHEFTTSTMYHRLLIGFLVVQTMIFWGAEISFAMAPSTCPSLPTPSGHIVNVSTESSLQSAINNLQSGDVIVIMEGTYLLTKPLYVPSGVVGASIIGETGDYNDVIIAGKGMNDPSVSFGFWLGNAQNITFAHFTLKNINQHAFIFNSGVQSPVIHNVRMVDIGDQFVKANPDSEGGGVNNGIVECSVMEYTSTAPDDYTNGVDVHTGQNWIIRNNLFKNILAPAGQLAGPAILMWNGSRDTITERNLFLNCARGIAYGLINRSDDHKGGIIRNNIFYRNTSQAGDVGIALANSANTKILNNTIFMSGTYPTAIEYRFAATTNVEIMNNLSDAQIQIRDGASGVVSNNISNAQTSWFVDVTNGNLHLLASATTAIDQGFLHADVTTDFDGELRPLGSAPDIGADEFGTITDNQAPQAPNGLRIQ